MSINKITCHRYLNAVPVIVMVLLASCTSIKKFRYFNDIPKDSVHLRLPDLPVPKTVVQIDDILEIKVAGKSDATTLDFTNKGPGFGNGQAIIPTYKVDKEGMIELYLIGKLKVVERTVEEIREMILPLVAKYLLQPAVNVRLINFRFTVLGEVRYPNTYTVANERITILEALGYAGDMTIYSERNNVTVIRDSSGIRELGVLDFGTKKVLESKFYYLKRNDVIYVQNKTRYREATDKFSRASLVVGILSGFLALTYLFIK